MDSASIVRVFGSNYLPINYEYVVIKEFDIETLPAANDDEVLYIITLFIDKFPPIFGFKAAQHVWRLQSVGICM